MRTGSSGRSGLAVAGLVAAGLAAGWVEAAPAARPAAQVEACTWVRIGASTQKLAFGASAMDTDRHTMIWYGGQDERGETKNIVEAVDLAGPISGAMPHRRITPLGALQELFGATGDYRARGADSAVFWLGGAKQTGDAQSLLQKMLTANNQVSPISPAGALGDRVFHAMAYDPVHDVLVVQGGATACDLLDVPAGCQADVGDTVFLRFDAMTGGVTAEGGPRTGGPGEVLGHSMVYDSAGRRMLVYGGTRDLDRAEGRIFVLNLADPQLANATWSTLPVSGAGPQDRFFHSAAYDGARNRMVIYGGVTRAAFTTSENALADTWALNLSGASPQWKALGATVGDRVGSVMEFDTAHNVPVLHGGRTRYKAGTQSASGDTHVLTCAVPTATAPPPPTGTRDPRTPSPTPGPTGGTPTAPPPQVCPFIQNKVPQPAIFAALANPAGVAGFGELCNPGLPPGPFNGPRRWLSLRNPGVPYHPLYNPVVYKCGCP